MILVLSGCKPEVVYLDAASRVQNFTEFSNQKAPSDWVLSLCTERGVPPRVRAMLYCPESGRGPPWKYVTIASPHANRRKNAESAKEDKTETVLRYDSLRAIESPPSALRQSCCNAQCNAVQLYREAAPPSGVRAESCRFSGPSYAILRPHCGCAQHTSLCKKAITCSARNEHGTESIRLQVQCP